MLLWFKIKREDKKERKIDLLKKLDEILDKYRLIFQENDISISFRYSQNDVFNILINDDHLDIILENLLTNAIKYTSNKKIDIVLLKEGNSIKFEITNGVRNLDKDIDKIWVPFYVGDISRDKNFSGTGLGLSIVREILNRYKLPFNVKLEDNKFKFYIYFS
ncbi:Sensor protein [Candidatus Arthromitus sp. SFB-4]|nr:Sensor protein [Candidatus Arthromitus sp. SFB-4]